MQTRIATLDQLVVDADREIDRLRTLIAQTGQAEPSIRMKPGPEIIGPAVSGGGEKTQPAADHESVTQFPQPQRRMILYLAQAGYTADEITHLLDCRPQAVQAVLDSQLPPDQQRAA